MTTKTKLPLPELLDKLWIDLADLPYRDLRKGKTLRAVHPEVHFVLAAPIWPSTGLAEAIDEAREVQATTDVPVMLVLLDHDDLDAVDRACGWDGDKPWSYNVPVRDVDMNGIGSIRLNTVGGTESPCEHGYMARYTTLARVLHKDDLFLVVDRNEANQLLLYRALAEYDRRKNRVLFERTTPGLEQPSKQYMDLPPNLLVYVSYDEIEDATPLSKYDAKMILAGD
jgi:hypothetical protein